MLTLVGVGIGVLLTVGSGMFVLTLVGNGVGSSLDEQFVINNITMTRPTIAVAFLKFPGLINKTLRLVF